HRRDWKFWVWNYSNETHSIDVEDWTPCAAGRLCMGGRCVDHPDALQHVIPQQQSGGIRVECDNEKSCVRFQGTLIEGKKALRLTSCENRSCKKKNIACPGNGEIKQFCYMASNKHFFAV
uniref:Uncharacterized protein n=1 Tax=Romanomermis culicivorax TaxID=13658 RepID=A0A915IK06_ROMCU